MALLRTSIRPIPSRNRLVLPMGTAMTVMQKGDTAPPLRAYLFQPDGTPANLVGATVAFRMRRWDSRELVVDAPAVVEDAPAGLVRYSWGAGDTDTPAEYQAWFVVTYASGGVESFPNADTHRVRIEP